MKRLIIPVILLIASGICYGQMQKSEEISQASKDAFAAEFPEAQKVKWSIEKPGEYEAEFVLNGTGSSALFDAQGNLVETETAVKENELPQAVKTAIGKEYAGYNLEEIKKTTDSEGNISFEMEASKGNIYVELTFDSSGKLLKKEALKSRDMEEKD